MEFKRFIIVEANKTIHKDETNKVTISGEAFFPLEEVVPVIHLTKGCFYLALISELRVTKTSTTIYFTAAKIGKEDGRAYYALYQNNNSVVDSVDYEDNDTVIPGAMRPVYAKHMTNKKRYKQVPSVGLSQYVDSDWDDGDDDASNYDW